MKKYRKHFLKLLMLISFSAFLRANAQENDSCPGIGDQLPEFELKEVFNYSMPKVSSPSLKGKWVILDFFSEGCSSCFKYLPHADQLSKQYHGKIEFFMIGLDSKRLRDFYWKYQQKLGLTIPVSFDKSFFYKMVPIGVPYVVWVNNDGVIDAISGLDDLNPENIDSFLHNRKFEFRNISYAANLERRDVVDASIPLLTNGNGGNDSEFLYRTLISKWKPTYDIMIPEFQLDHRQSYQAIGLTLSELYKYAFTGKESWSFGDTLYDFLSQNPILDMRDSSLFRANYKTGENYFCYSVKLPAVPGKNYNLQEILKNDLKNMFGYRVTIEDRTIPCWKLVTLPGFKKEAFITKGGKKKIEFNYTGISLTNSPIKNILIVLVGFHVFANNISLVDETNIRENLDIKLDWLLTDFGSIQLALRSKGLELKQGYRQMKALVIRDP